MPPSCRDPDLFWWVRSSSGWPESEDSHPRHIGAGSSLRNKVVIRRLSYLDLFLMVASSSYMPKEIVAVSKQGTRGTGGDGQTSQSLLKNQGMSAEYPFPFKKLENKRKTKRSKKTNKNKLPNTSARQGS